jgi:microcystin-dependent protein
MGQDIQKGTIYAEGGIGGAGRVNATNLNAHVDEARIKATFISSKSLKDPANLSDSLIVESSGILYRETHQQIVDLINTTIQALLPIGTIVDFAGVSEPAGWLLCYGQEVLRDIYDELYGVIGVTYGAGDSVTTFNLPDLRGRIAAGKDDMGGTAASRLTAAWGPNGLVLGATGGNEKHVLTTAQLASHAHSYTNTSVQAGPGIATGSGIVPVAQNTANAGGGLGHPNVQPTIVVNKIIRAQ